MSIVRELYGQYACPLARVVRGLPISWDPVLVTTYREGFFREATWSPCSRFIATINRAAIEILDAATLERLNTFKPPPYVIHSGLSFSPDGRVLTGFDGEIISWDPQTGGLITPFISAPTGDSPISFAYSVDGRVIAVLDASHSHSTSIYTCDLLSGTHIGSFLSPGEHIVNPIWTHGEYLRFVTLKPGSITVWEVPFTLGHTPATVRSFPAPEECTATWHANLLFLPALYQLAFVVLGTVFIWDAQNSRFLLKYGPTTYSTDSGPSMSFSSDGGFFACTMGIPEVHVWKKSPASYILHQKLELPFGSTVARLSPNGKSIIAAGDSTIRLWHTRDQLLSLPSVPACEDGEYFILAFSPDEASAAFTRLFGNTVTVLDLRSGDLRLTIDAGMEIRCLGVTGSLVAVAGEGKIVTWNLPVDGCVGARASINDGVHTTTLLDCSDLKTPTEESISPDLTRVAIKGYSPYRLQIHDTASGRQLAGTELSQVTDSVALDEHGLWLIDWQGLMRGWKIVEDQQPLNIKLETLERTACPSRVFWQSRRGYEVTHDGWVLSPTQKRLLWLPHPWRSYERYRMWSGRFLGLRHAELPEVVILEFFESPGG